MLRRELIAAVLLGTAAMASAHGVGQREGLVVVSGDRVVSTIEVDAGSEEATLAELIVRDGEGRRCPARITKRDSQHAADHVRLTIEHALPGPPRWLSFQLAPDAEPTGRARRLTLSVTAEGEVAARRVTLTSGGNVETLRFGTQGPPAPCGPAALDRHPERLQGVLALMRFDSRARESVRLDVVLPLGILETWLPLSRADPGGLSVAEQEAARGPVAALVGSHLMAVHGERRLASEPHEVVFLGLDDAAVGALPAPRRLDAWTARVRVSVGFSALESLDWELWNAQVTTARVIVMDGGACEERRVSTYHPRL